MAAFLDLCRFVPTAGGTTDWTFSSAVGGCQSPAAANAVSGTLYKFLAISNDLTQWEIAEGAYSSAGAGSFARTTVLYSSSGTGTKTPGQSGAGTKISFSTVPQVAIIGVKEDLISVEEANGFTTTQKSRARANIDALKKNYIVNGAMMVSQENGTTAGTANPYFPVDQFQVNNNSAGVISSAQVASASPAGSPNRIRVTVTTADASVGTTDAISIYQAIEGSRVADLRSGSASAKMVTLQFGVKAPAGTYCLSIRNGASNRSYVAEFTIAVGEANTDVVKSATIPLDQTGTWSTDNTACFFVTWALMAGSTFQTTANSWAAGNFFGTSNQFNFMGTNGNVFELFDVGIYEGAAAPSFQVPDFASELEACQRYWEKSYDYGTSVAAATYTGAILGICPGNINRVFWNTPYYPKRADPTVTIFSPQTGASAKCSDLGTAGEFAVSINTTASQKTSSWTCSAGIPSTADQIYIHWTANARM